jgi:hypothetical protein
MCQPTAIDGRSPDRAEMIRRGAQARTLSTTILLLSSP